MIRLSCLDKPGMLGAGIGVSVLMLALLLAVAAEIYVTECKMEHALHAYGPELTGALVHEDWLRLRQVIEAVYFPEIAFVSVKAANYSYIYPFALDAQRTCQIPVMRRDISSYQVPMAQLEACVDVGRVVSNLLHAKMVLALALCAAVACGIASAWPLWLHRRSLAKLTSVLSAWSRGQGGCREVCQDDPLVRNLTELVGETLMRQKSLAKQAAKVEALEDFGLMASEVAHDIRAPLCALQVALGADDWRNEEMRSLAQMSSQRISEIAENLLVKRRAITALLDAAKRSPTDDGGGCIPVCLGTLVDEIAREQRAQSREQQGISVVVACQPTPLWVMSEPKSLRRALSNLASNAVESLHGSGQVTLTVCVLDGRAQILVEDTGCGMSPEHLSRALAGGYTHGKPRGNGLGLSAARRAVLAFGGEFEATSELGMGTSIAVTFPVHAAAATQPG